MWGTLRRMFCNSEYIGGRYKRSCDYRSHSVIHDGQWCVSHYISYVARYEKVSMSDRFPLKIYDVEELIDSFIAVIILLRTKLCLAITYGPQLFLITSH